MMLVLTRKIGQRMVIGDDVILTVLKIQGDRVQMGFTAPPHLPINREEVWQRIQAEQTETAARKPSGSSYT